ncbi:MAG: hypothetical protein EBZ77_12335 [Chitinophagia bacterium]|nr:hypothetical protein [Chitinophagia bacterium]
MKTDKEVRALMTLLDDPDTDVYDTVASKILHYGRDIIPTLEHFWEVTPDEAVQGRIEDLIHRVHFQDLEAEFADWARSSRPELLRGAILIAKYQYPQLNVPHILNQFDIIRKNVWLELNNMLSPVEQVNVFNSILYSYYKLQGHELTAREPKHFFINQVLESRNGNAFSIGVLYLALCEMLDITLFAVDIPRQFIFGFLHIVPDLFQSFTASFSRVQFFVDPLNGTIYSQNDVEAYLNRLNVTNRLRCYEAIDNKTIISTI